MRVLLDTNIILDEILKREPFYDDAVEVLRICESKNPSLAPHTVSNIFYIVRRELSTEETKTTIRKLLRFVDVIPIGYPEIMAALDHETIVDFEDALQDVCADEYDAEYIISRDSNGFAGSKVPIISPSDFIAMFNR
ncbi:MAG: PIN domain-containing protein [Candidatus Ancillula sp.]|jgi:predicted nucleic acid-binding protein|nr:PIN domain-containing protein [Candidatus Ancillula sp.]